MWFSLFLGRRNRYINGLKEEVDEHAFFSEPSGSMRSLSGPSMDDSWQLTPLTMSTSCSKQRSCSGLQSEYSYLQLQSLSDSTKQPEQDHQHCFVLGSDIKKEQSQKTVHRFFDEWPPKERDSWLDLDDKSSDSSSVSTTRLSISAPTSFHDFPIFNSRSHNGNWNITPTSLSFLIHEPYILFPVYNTMTLLLFFADGWVFSTGFSKSKAKNVLTWWWGGHIFVWGPRTAGLFAIFFWTFLVWLCVFWLKLGSYVFCFLSYVPFPLCLPNSLNE